jgi:catechol 2,3-dioxygenase-like lactoylglutathione lyase family enzyme
VKWNPIVPELSVSNYRESVDFFEKIVGFSVVFERENPSFAYLDLHGAQLMIEEDHDTAWLVASLEKPRGRGINLQIDVPDVNEVQKRLDEAGIVPFRAMSETSYETPEGDSRQLELLVQDPDGYLIRLVSYFE